MEVTIAAVISVDGKITRHDDTNLHEWVSKEDQAHFKQFLQDNDAIVYGRHVYEESVGHLELEPDKLRIVLTSSPDKFREAEVEGQLEFRNETPKQTVDYLDSLGKQRLLVAGGERMITEFLAAGVVDELILTVEPRIFGQGIGLVDSVPLDVNLSLIEQSQLNHKGTMLLKYRIES